MKSGVVKQKWTAEEEAALRAGVEKYGAGKWRAIQKDANFGACLISRSNVDLKDKWRNMSVSANGLGSRDRAARNLAAKMKQVGTTLAQEDLGTEGAVVDTLFMSNAAEENKLFGARFDHIIEEAILNLQETNEGSKGQIANYLESHYPVPSNFRRLLATKLKLLTQQGRLIKMRRHYIMTRDLGLLDESRKLQDLQEAIVKKKVQSDFQASEEIAMKFKSMDASEVAMVVAQAVADAEVAAAAAVEAARVAEIAEAEWKAAEAAAEMAAALATGRSRSCDCY